MKQRWRILGSVALLAVLALRLDWAALAAGLGRARPGLWLAALATYLAAQVLSSLRWQLLAAPLGFGGPTVRYVAYYFIGMFFNLVLPTAIGGDVVRAWYLSGQAEAPAFGRRAGAALSVFAERLSGVMMLVGLACAALPFAPPMPWWVGLAVGAVAGGAVFGLLGLLAARPLLDSAAGRLLGDRRGRLLQLAEGCRACVRDRRVLLVTSLLSLLVQASGVGLVALVGASLRLPVPWAYYGVMVPLVTLLTLLPVSVNGMGLREVGYVVLLRPLGVEPPAAVLLALLSFAVMTAASLGGLVFYLFGRFPRFAPAQAAAAVPARAEERAHGQSAVGGHSHQGRAGQPPAAA